jgi:zinc transport system ATP-binding protein
MNAVEVNNIYVKFEENVILENVCLSVPEGDFLGIIGPNGGGKTTLLKIILGLIKPDSGSVEIFGSDISKSQHLVSYVPQYSVFDLTYPISVFDVVLTGRLNKKKMLGSYKNAYGGELERRRKTENTYCPRFGKTIAGAASG